ncbi:MULTISPECIES: ABC transporter ATP-binding protein [unclassified Nocardiopsis]|uniref:ABC transporter ATP-binding protein n=1 Tax=Nocardiopsis TaxID=2013 RepID=UPI00387B8ACA
MTAPDTATINAVPTVVGERAPAGLALEEVTVAFAGARVVEGLSLAAAPGEVLVLTGPSGCGKSTLLRVLAGLLAPDSGTASADGVPVTGTGADRALVFQDDALLPWLTVRRNVELALRLRGVPRAERRARAEKWIGEVGLAGFGDHLPRRLSGGMRQRVQLARTLIGAPRAVLMDEPFGALDTRTRADVQDLLVRTLAAHPATVVFVTHDVDEAVFLGDRVAVLGPAGTGVREVVPVPRPRERAARDTAPVREARARVLAALSHPAPTTAAAPPQEAP